MPNAIPIHALSSPAASICAARAVSPARVVSAGAPTPTATPILMRVARRSAVGGRVHACRRRRYRTPAPTLAGDLARPRRAGARLNRAQVSCAPSDMRSVMRRLRHSRSPKVLALASAVAVLICSATALAGGNAYKLRITPEGSSRGPGAAADEVRRRLGLDRGVWSRPRAFNPSVCKNYHPKYSDLVADRQGRLVVQAARTSSSAARQPPCRRPPMVTRDWQRSVAARGPTSRASGPVAKKRSDGGSPVRRTPSDQDSADRHPQRALPPDHRRQDGVGHAAAWPTT